jgi:hypothetical protein
MCDPVSATVAAVGATTVVAGTVMSASAAKKAAKAQNAALAYNAGVAEHNAYLAEQDAQWVEKAGREDLDELNRSVEQLKSTQRSSFAGSGVVVDSGSALAVIENTARGGSLDALTFERNIAREASNIRAQGGNYQAQANLTRMQMLSPQRAFNNTLLTGATQLGAQAISIGASGGLGGGK